MFMSELSSDANFRLALFTLLACLTINFVYNLRQRQVDWVRVYSTIKILLYKKAALKQLAKMRPDVVNPNCMSDK